MKLWVTLVIIFSCDFFSLSSEEKISQSFHYCQKQYDEKIGELIASSGMQAASTVWKILFDNLDLNSNSRLSASEIVVKLGMNDITVHEQMTVLHPQAQQWIDLAQPEDSDHELKLDGFVDAIGKTIGRVEKVKPKNENASDFLIYLCKYFNRKIPEIVSTIQDLSNCTSFLKRDQIQTMGLKPKKIIGNTWRSTFSSLDADGDRVVSVEELSQAFMQSKFNLTLSHEKAETRLKSFIAERILNQAQFLRSITSLLFDSSTWGNVTSTSQLIGKQMFCDILRNVRNNVISWVEKNKRCVNAYKQALLRHLGRDSKIAPGYMHALGDKNKDGDLSQSELESLVHSVQDRNFRVIDLLGSKSYSIQAIPMPDVILEIGNNTNGDPLELSLFSTKQHKAWNSFCFTAIKLIQSFPETVGDFQNNLTNSKLIDLFQNRLQTSQKNKRNELIKNLKVLIASFSEVDNPAGNESVENSSKETIRTNPSEIAVTSPRIIPTQSDIPKLNHTNANVSTISNFTKSIRKDYVQELYKQAQALRLFSHKVITKEEKELHALVATANNGTEIAHNHIPSSEEKELEKLMQDALTE